MYRLNFLDFNELTNLNFNFLGHTYNICLEMAKYLERCRTCHNLAWQIYFQIGYWVQPYEEAALLVRGLTKNKNEDKTKVKLVFFLKKGD